MKIMTNQGRIVCKMAQTYGHSKLTGVYAAARAVNELAATGAKAYQAEFHIMTPEGCGRSRVNTVKKHIINMCREQKIDLAGIEQEENAAVRLPVVSVCLTGEVPGEKTAKEDAKPYPGQAVVLTKWIAVEGMLRVEQERSEELKAVFSTGFIRQIRSFDSCLFDTREVDIAYSVGADYIYAAGKGGILAALWNLAKDLRMGIDLDMKAISVRQETIEVCEQFRLNPYQLASSGCFLILADDGPALVKKLMEEDIQASVIGKITDSNDKVIHNGDEVRYIDRPAADEIGKIF